MFEHEEFHVYAYDEIPLEQDCYLMSDEYMQEYEQAFLAYFQGGPDFNIGYISNVVVRKINRTSIDLSWYPDIITRLHEVPVSLPKDQILKCVDCWQYSDKPHIFVKAAWIKQLHLRFYSIFCLVDAIGFEDALRSQKISRDQLLLLRSKIDDLAASQPNVAFLSFADSLLLKSNWTVGHVESTTTNTYRPESILEVLRSIQTIYRDVIGLGVYAVVTQGSNEYYNDPLLHESITGHHICLNSLGLPFAQLQAIDREVKEAVKEGRHQYAELYLDAPFYHSLQLRSDYVGRKAEKHSYITKLMSNGGSYYCGKCQELLDNLRPVADEEDFKQN